MSQAHILYVFALVMSAVGLQHVSSDAKARDRDAPNPVILVVDHVPKCGGTFVNFMAETLVDADSLRLVHEEFQLTADDYGPGKFVVGMVRNPFEYYISMWVYQGYFDRVTQEEMAAMRPLGVPAGSHPEDPARFSKFLHFFSDPEIGLLSWLMFFSYLDADGVVAQTGWDWKGTVSDAFSDATTAASMRAKVLTALRGFSLEDSPVDCWVYTEDATAATRACFQRFSDLGGKVDMLSFEAKVEDDHTNSREHLGCSAIYTQETLDFVRSGDSELFRAFGYPLECTA
eukprot:CAMPEP_0178409306 /NCGR_PEP_ID=MMETSP0689_2-20121128/20395_1 /TAXON_ID=160604 /ORGANISM="Amphidinium massartii, Strain CS-259" /LENGTH=286 /DNA_ID=CAMNT_0020030445 /DNA_START=106 /DNA_END=966 /DNA_ORIENTATION=-